MPTNCRPGLIDKAFIALFFLFALTIPFDGLVRAMAFRIGVPVLDGWKEAFFGLIVLIYLLLIFRCRAVQQNADFGLRWALWGIILSGLASGMVAWTHGTNVSEIAWGLKILYYYSPVFLIFWFPPWGWGAKIAKWSAVAVILASLFILPFGLWQAKVGWEGTTELLFGQPIYGHTAGIRIATMEGVYRPAGTFRQPSAYGSFAMLILFLILAFWPTQRGLFRKVFFAALALLAMAGLAVSTSRVAILGSAAGVSMLALMVLLPHGRLRWIGALGVLAIVPLLLASYNGVIANWGLERDLYLTDNSSYYERLDMWSDVFRDWSQRSPAQILFGVGPGAQGAARVRFGDPDAVPVDNFYLLILYNQGVFGLFAWLTFLLVLLKRALAMNFGAEGHWSRLGAMLLMATLTQAWFMTTLEGFPAQVYCWIFFAAGVLRHESQPVQHQSAEQTGVGVPHAAFIG